MVMVKSEVRKASRLAVGARGEEDRVSRCGDKQIGSARASLHVPLHGDARVSLPADAIVKFSRLHLLVRPWIECGLGTQSEARKPSLSLPVSHRTLWSCFVSPTWDARSVQSAWVNDCRKVAAF